MLQAIEINVAGFLSILVWRTENMRSPYHHVLGRWLWPPYLSFPFLWPSFHCGFLLKVTVWTIWRLILWYGVVGKCGSTRVWVLPIYIDCRFIISFRSTGHRRVVPIWTGEDHPVPGSGPTKGHGTIWFFTPISARCFGTAEKVCCLWQSHWSCSH